MRILFVCTGNSCRSPMAEAYFGDLCRRAGRRDIEALSAGSSAWTGAPASEAAIAVMAEFGVDLDSFRSTRLSPQLIADCDLVVAMTAGHRHAVLELAPEAADKCILLLGDRDVVDPYGGSVGHYRRIFEMMRPALETLFQRVSAGN